MMQRQGVEQLEFDTSTKINNNFFSFLSDKGLKDTTVNYAYCPFKGTDRQCKVVKLSMQCCGKFFNIHLRHIKLFKDL